MRISDWSSDVCSSDLLPLDDRSVERVTIAFGLRNVTRIDAALAEMRRVLKPGGRFLCLEFSKPTPPWLDPTYDAYSFRVLPWLRSAERRGGKTCGSTCRSRGSPNH